MSADKDRGIRRQKQKRAKSIKKPARPRPEAGEAKAGAPTGGQKAGSPA